MKKSFIVMTFFLILESQTLKWRNRVGSIRF